MGFKENEGETLETVSKDKNFKKFYCKKAEINGLIAGKGYKENF